MTRNRLVSAVVFGLVVTALFWIDPLFVPLALLGPPIMGALTAWKGLPVSWVIVTWAVAGLGAVVSDFVVNQEDVLFHVVLTGFVVGLAVAAWAVTPKLSRRDARTS